ncbi:hypothetical protein DPMN_157241 [Dreissena polymorpha]|uniref:Uncharacterized protein n=1 Tax=Dreissena polymorpha TaxID=45954 RepID=A0A9D4EGU9_DREPO|nr:hypothetical protein DPMN_157241 [Dreissena polymorpha]
MEPAVQWLVHFPVKHLSQQNIRLLAYCPCTWCVLHSYQEQPIAFIIGDWSCYPNATIPQVPGLQPRHVTELNSQVTGAAAGQYHRWLLQVSRSSFTQDHRWLLQVSRSSCTQDHRWLLQVSRSSCTV